MVDATLVALPIHCGHCHAPVMLHVRDFEGPPRNADPVLATWVCPMCLLENAARVTGRVHASALRPPDR